MASLRDGDKIRIRNHNGAYLYADESKGYVFQKKADSSTPNVLWTVEKVGTRFCLKSCYGNYFAMTCEGGLVVQNPPKVLIKSPQKAQWWVYEPLSSWTESKKESEVRYLLISSSGSYALKAEVDHNVIAVSVNIDADNEDHHFPPWALWNVEVTGRGNNNTSMIRCGRSRPAVAAERPVHRRLPPQFPPECHFDAPPPSFEPPAASLVEQMLFSSAPLNFVHNYYYSGRDSIYSNSGHNINLSGTQSNGSIDAHNSLPR